MPYIASCSLSGKNFEVSDLEVSLRQSFECSSYPTVSPEKRIQMLGAFWPHWNLHNRKSDLNGKPIISIFPENCPYPVWEREEWIANNNPPTQNYNFSQPFFAQAWELFQKCPLPHNFQSHNENSEYTDDWYHSKNCYLCHSGQYCENTRYSYGCTQLMSTHFAILSFNSELCRDLVYSKNCYNTLHSLYCRNLQDCAFLFDCRNCQNCMFSTNLRNKEYYFGNVQLTKEQYLEKKAQWNFASRHVYEQAQVFFQDMILTRAWHRAGIMNTIENCTGNLQENCKNCINCYMLSYHEDCVNIAFSGPNAKTLLDSLGTIGAERTYMCCLPVFCYQTRYSFSISHCKLVDYCAYCFQCQNCFGCCGLVSKQYCIFNKQYTKEEYEALLPQIISHMQQTGEWGTFFPGYFAPNSYDESWSGYYFPINESDQSSEGYRISQHAPRETLEYESPTRIPDTIQSLGPEERIALTKKVFWDDIAKRPFKIYPEDIEFAQKTLSPLPSMYYIRAMQQNLRWLPGSCALEETSCALCTKKVQTAWSKNIHKRILCESCYEQTIYG